MKIGYCRVSTQEQNLQLQIDELKRQGCQIIYEEKASGRNTTDRPEYLKMIASLRDGDTLVIWDISRLGRSMVDLVQIIISLKERNVEFHSIKDNIDTSTAAGRFQYHMLCAMAEYNRSMIGERTRAGLEVARRAGRVGGRPEGKSVDNRKKAQSLRALVTSGVSINDAAKQLGLGRATGYRWMKEEEV